MLELKGKVKEIFGQAKFDLHKWHSNVPDLEENKEARPSVQSYAKEQLGVKPGEKRFAISGHPRKSGSYYQKRNSALPCLRL